MNQAHLHLLLVHIPILLVPLGVFLLAVSHRLKQVVLQQTALFIIVGAALGGGAAFLVGEGAEELVEDRPGISESIIESHEEAAEVAIWCTAALGVAAALQLAALLLGLSFGQLLTLPIFALGLIASISLAYTGQQGGKIRHPEAFDAQSISGEVNGGHANVKEEGGEKEDDDD